MAAVIEISEQLLMDDIEPQERENLRKKSKDSFQTITT